MTDPDFPVSRLGDNGFALIRSLVERSLIDDLLSTSPTVVRGGVRNLLRVAPQSAALAEHTGIRGLVSAVLGDGAFVTRAILFDKSPDANWALGWHQDTAIAVAVRIETEGFGPWSMKGGVQHVRPPAAVLEQMVTVRIHLDACPATNGALQVVPGSHLHGLLSEERGRELAAGPLVTCEAEPGDVLLMRPLLLHASGKQEVPGHRRIAHFEFAAAALPGSLRWAEAR